jgi:hypothetical protein
MFGSQQISFGGDALCFSFAKNTLFFTLIVQQVFSFSRTAFSFRFLPWFLFRSCYIFASRCICTSGLCWYSSKELSQKGLNGVGKEKKFHAKSGTKRSLFRLRLRILVIFAVAWLVSNDWDCLMSLWKKLFVVFIMWKHLFSFLLDALFGVTWRMLTTCLTQTSHHKPLWWFFLLVMPFYASS